MPKNNKRRGKASPKTSKNNHNQVHNSTHVPNAWVGMSNVPRLVLSDDTTYTFVQDQAGSSITQVAGTTVFGALAFRLSYVDQAATFSALFDEYRIMSIQVTFRPTTNMGQLQLTNVITPTFVTVIDLDDGSTPTTFGQLREYNNALPTVFEVQQRTFTPGTLVGANVQRRTWIDMASYNTQDFHGIKYGLEGGSGGQTALQVISYTTRYHFECRRTR